MTVKPAQLNNKYVRLSMNLLEKIKKGEDTKKIQGELEVINSDTLAKYLATDEQKKAFWINLYNSFIQIRLSEKPQYFKERSTFFGTPLMIIAGKRLSFDDIEHGIIRKSRIKISLGYLRKWFRPKWERKLRVKNIDWRIHFALNCGAKSCPPVAVYTSENLDKEFNFMTKQYLKEQTTYNSQTKTAKSVALMSWFRGDFGGKCGAKKILFNYKITPEKPKNLEFKNYDWTLLLGNFRTIPK